MAGSGFPVARWALFSKDNNTFTCFVGNRDEAAAITVAAELINCSVLIHGNESNVKHMPDEMIPQFVKLVKPTGPNAGPVDGHIRRPVPTWRDDTLDELANWWKELGGADLWREHNVHP